MKAPVNKNIRPELSELFYRLSLGSDENRPQAVERRRQNNQRTARENIKDLLDSDSFIEYGALNIAAQRSRKPIEELITTTPADGLITGIGTVNAPCFGEEKARCMILSYDYTVLAGTQGFFNHKKIDRMLGLVNKQRLPLIYFAEGGGGRPGDTDAEGVMITGLNLSTFGLFGSLSGKVPLVGLVRPSFPCLDKAKKKATLEEKTACVLKGDDKGALFAWKMAANAFQYSASRVPEIADTIVEIDNAMKWGYNFEKGPFEMWDTYGVQEAVQRMEKERLEVPGNVKAMLDTGNKRFYKLENGIKNFYDFTSSSYKTVPSGKSMVSIAAAKGNNRTVLENESATLVDIGDGVFREKTVFY